MDERLQFPSRKAFRSWLEENHALSPGVWLLFGKPGGPKTVTASEALEEALCFGWIDGQMRSLDDKTYIKYFAARRENSKWSEKNKALAAQLEQQGIMTDHGKVKIAAAKKNGQWDAPRPTAITDEQISMLTDRINGHEPAYTNFQAMSPSVKKTYTRAYLDAKTDAGRASRLSWILQRLDNNLKPM